MDAALLNQALDLLRGHAGWRVRETDSNRVEAAVGERMRRLRIRDPRAYRRRLADSGPEGGGELEALLGLLTNNESYFFRDAGQFELLRSRLLPELIRRRTPERTLRLWSAGCSTGEEPYSLAITLDALLPDRDSWRVLLLATDLDGDAVRRARIGRYGAWSFRGSAPDASPHFRRSGSEWEVDQRIREMVTFRVENLLGRDDPQIGGIEEGLDRRDRAVPSERGPSKLGSPAKSEGFDLILCRNVFIYLAPEAVAAVSDRLARALREDGYLLTGHAEMLGDRSPLLRAVVFPESVVYVAPASLPVTCGVAPASLPVTRGVEATPAPPSPICPPPRTAPPAPLPAVPRAQPPAVRNAGYQEAPGTAENRITGDLQEYESCCAAAEACANLGQHDEALEYCKRAQAIDPFGTRPLYLMAHISLERGETAAAKELLRKLIYAAPSSAAPYLELADLYEQDGDRERARRTRESAVRLLRTLPPEQRLEPYEGVCVADALESVRRALSRTA